ncbi:MAG: NAD(+) diphosphatase [Pseudomonadota bacterium]|nr:NAD(+) diphosphatase [Pseudomonadota bacterium]
MAVSTTQWIPGWTNRQPERGDLILTLTGSGVVKPESGWLHARDNALFSQGLPDAVSLGSYGGRDVFVTELPESRVAGREVAALMDALLILSDAPVDMLSTGFQVWQWWRDHRYCGRCGEPTGFHPLERAKWCEPCGIPWYPRLAPCVIVVIRRDDRLLLARSSRARMHFYSLVAGFVEPGESLEGAVHREVKEETGLDITNIRYHASQPWPFPHQLMVGFFADYAGGELVLQEDELADADWFLPGDTPPVPPETTIAGRLIRAMENEISRGGIPV